MILKESFAMNIDDRSFIDYIYIDLARAKSEALDNIYSLLKQNIKSCNAKRRRHATPENGENNKGQLCTCSTLFCTFLCRCFARLQRETSRKSPHVRESGFRNPGIFCFWNPESWALESGIQHCESGILLKIGIRNPTY